QTKQPLRQELRLEDEPVSMPAVDEFWGEVAMASVGLVIRHGFRTEDQAEALLPYGQRVVPLLLAEEVFLRQQTDLVQDSAGDEHHRAGATSHVLGPIELPLVRFVETSDADTAREAAHFAAGVPDLVAKL